MVLFIAIELLIMTDNIYYAVSIVLDKDANTRYG